MDTPRRRPWIQLRTNLTRSGGCGPPWPSSTTDAHRILVGPRRDTSGVPPSRRRSDNERRGSSMTIRRRESKDGPRFDVEWRLRIAPNGPRRSSPNARHEYSKLRLSPPSPAATSWIHALAGSPWRRSMDVARLTTRPEPKGAARIRRQLAQPDRTTIRQMAHRHASTTNRSKRGSPTWSESGLSPRTVRWVHSVLKMSLDYAIDDGLLPARNPAARTKFPPQRHTSHTYLSTGEVAALAAACGARATSSHCWPTPVCDSGSWSVSASTS